MLQPGDKLVVGRREARRRRRDFATQIAQPQVRAARRRDGCKAADAGDGDRRARRQAADRRDHADLRRPASSARGSASPTRRARASRCRSARRVDRSLDRFWFITKQTLELPARLIDPEQRKEISRHRRLLRGHAPDDPQRPRRRRRHPRDHLALAGDREPVPVPAARRRPHLLGDRGEGARQAGVRSRVMERAGVVGFMLVILTCSLIGLSNDIDRLSGEGFRRQSRPARPGPRLEEDEIDGGQRPSERRAARARGRSTPRPLCEAFQLTARGRTRTASRCARKGDECQITWARVRRKRGDASPPGSPASGVERGDTVGADAHQPARVPLVDSGRDAPRRDAVLDLQHLRARADRVPRRATPATAS